MVWNRTGGVLIVKKILSLLVLILLTISSNCFAITFSQPVKIGAIVYANMGGFVFKQVSHNDGTLRNDRGSIQRKAYDHGVARFSEGSDALYLHYTAYKNANERGFSKFGASDIDNTINVNIMIPEIFKITSNEGITLYAINDSYDLPEEFTYTLIGRRKDGKWVKYFDTNDITAKYFGKSGYWLKNFIVNGDNISIYYELYSKGYYRNPIGRGEFRFKWDDKAQWFGVEQIKY